MNTFWEVSSLPAWSLTTTVWVPGSRVITLLAMSLRLLLPDQPFTLRVSVLYSLPSTVTRMSWDLAAEKDR